MVRTFFLLMSVLLAPIGAAFAADEKASANLYEPMKVFEPLDGRVLRGEGTGPNGQPIVDIAMWEMILGGRAIQSTHRLECGDYGGRTIFFYDEGAKKYVFHYFTTTGFHTIGEIEPTETGFVAIEKVEGHPEIVEVRSEMVFDDNIVRVVSTHMDKEGHVSDGDGLVYRNADRDAVLLLDEADALFGKRSNVRDAHDRFGKCD